MYLIDALLKAVSFITLSAMNTLGIMTMSENTVMVLRTFFLRFSSMYSFSGNSRYFMIKNVARAMKNELMKNR